MEIQIFVISKFHVPKALFLMSYKARKQEEQYISIPTGIKITRILLHNHNLSEAAEAVHDWSGQTYII